MPLQNGFCHVFVTKRDLSLGLSNILYIFAAKIIKRHDKESLYFPECLINLVKNKNYAEDDCFNPFHATGHTV